MEFASKYGYNYGHQGSDSEEVSDEDVETTKHVKRRIRKADSNVISVRFDQLVLPNEMFAGEPIKCKKCQAIMSSFSKANLKSDSENGSTKWWECEFCNEKNDVSKVLSVSLDELPKVSDVTFLIEPAPTKQNDKEGVSQASNDNNLLSYCIDVSGSMDTMIQTKNMSSESDTIIDTNMSRLQGVQAACIENINHLKVNEPNKRVSLITFSDAVKYFGDGTKCTNNQPLERIGGYDSGDLFVTPVNVQNSYYQQQQVQQSYQMPAPQFQQFDQHFQTQQCDQQAQTQQFDQQAQTQQFDQLPVQQIQIQQQIPIQQIQQISLDEDKAEGEGEDEEEEEAGYNYRAPAIAESESLLDNKEKLMAFARNLELDLKPIKDTFNNLEYRIKKLQTEGSTALGPALVFSISLLSKQPGSQVFLCTDGCANIGMGSVETGDPKVAEKFYEDLADQAKSFGVTVNVISMEGTDCKLALLGKVADRSNGTLSIVNPTKLGEQFKSILENRIVATSVKAKLIVNSKYLYIRDEELEAAEGKAVEKNDQAAKDALEVTKKSIIEKDIGNANIDTEITFEYGVRKLKDGTKASELFKELPFQLQITYTTLDGAKAMRVYTKMQEFTKDRKQAEQSVLSELLYANVAQKMSHHVASNNVFMAKIKGRQMQHQQQANSWSAPTGYTQTERVVGKLSNSTRMEDLADEDAEKIYSSKKVSSNKMKK